MITMSDITEALILELDRAIAEGKSAIVDGEISIAELENELVEKRVYLAVGQTVLAALLRRREELTQAPPSPPPAPETALPVAGNVYVFTGSDYEARSPKMPEGRTVEHPAVEINRTASARILSLLEVAASSNLHYTVAYITDEVYGEVNQHTLKKCAMRLYDLQRKEKVWFDRPITASTVVRMHHG